MPRQAELAFIKAVQRSDFPILSSAAEESSGGWQEEGPCGLQDYSDERFGPRAPERSWELGFDLLISVSRCEQQESRRDSSTDGSSEPACCCRAPGHLFCDGTEAQGSTGEVAARAASISDLPSVGWHMLWW
jgi:hypothetical protein